MKRNMKLDKYEQQIEDNIHLLKPVSARERKRIDNIVAHARKSRSISLRISEHDLRQLKNRAGEAGVKYQTLINDVLRKYITNKFYEKDEVIKTLDLIKKNQ